MAALEEVVMRLDRHARVLLIADRVEFAHQFLYRLKDTGVPSCFVDRDQFLHLQTFYGSELTPWPGSQVFALTAGLALKDDVAASLRRQHWDLVLLLDTNFATTQRWAVGFQVEPTRVLWKARPGYDLSNLDKTEWSVDHVTIREVVSERDHYGSDSLRLIVSCTVIEPEASEVIVAVLIEELIQSTKGTKAEGLANTLRTRWLSSPASLESGLRRVEAALNWQWPLFDEIPEDPDEDVVEVSNAFGASDKSKALQLVKECLEALDELVVDNKLRSLVHHLRERSTRNSTCIFVRYRDTATYLTSALEDEGLSCVLVHGGMSTAEVYARQHDFLQTKDQVLVMTTAMLVGTDLREIRDLVLYDAPATLDVLSQMLARFHLFESSPLRVTLIGDSYGVNRTHNLIAEAAQFVV
jgi:hypothetical protein